MNTTLGNKPYVRVYVNTDEVFPGSSLPLKEEERKFKYGQFGYGKYVYSKETLQEMDSLFSRELERNFPGSRVEYLV